MTNFKAKVLAAHVLKSPKYKEEQDTLCKDSMISGKQATGSHKNQERRDIIRDLNDLEDELSILLNAENPDEHELEIKKCRNAIKRLERTLDKMEKDRSYEIT